MSGISKQANAGETQLLVQNLHSKIREMASVPGVRVRSNDDSIYVCFGEIGSKYDFKIQFLRSPSDGLLHPYLFEQGDESGDRISNDCFVSLAKRISDTLRALRGVTSHGFRDYLIASEACQDTNTPDARYSTGKDVCPVCRGDGGAAGWCRKCHGSGWA